MFSKSSCASPPTAFSFLEGALQLQGSIRRMTEQDLVEVQVLADQLGYPLSIDELRERFSYINHQDDHTLFVACADQGSKR